MSIKDGEDLAFRAKCIFYGLYLKLEGLTGVSRHIFSSALEFSSPCALTPYHLDLQIVLNQSKSTKAMG